MAATTETSVASAGGAELRARIWQPDASGPSPGLVLVDGSGNGTVDDWDDWALRLTACGAVVLGHDKPGCGDSPGDWRTQTLPDRAAESLAALATLRTHPAVAGQPLGLFGISQGGWVALLAATLGAVDYVISLSGPGVSPAVQDRTRIERDLQAAAIPAADRSEGLAWIDERTARLRAGEPVGQVLAAQARYGDRSWYPIATRYFDNPENLAFLAGILDVEPAEILPRITCPVLALFGAADPLVPVADSVAAFAQHLQSLSDNPHGLAVFPGADHGLFTAPSNPATSRTDQLAAGVLPMITEFLTRAVSAADRQ